MAAGESSCGCPSPDPDEVVTRIGEPSVPVCLALLAQWAEGVCKDGDFTSANGINDGGGADAIDDEEDSSRVRAGDTLHSGLGIGCHVFAGAGLLRGDSGERPFIQLLRCT